MEQMELGLEQMAHEAESNLLQVIIFVLAKRLGLKQIDFTEDEMKMSLDGFEGVEISRGEDTLSVALLEEAKIIQ